MGKNVILYVDTDKHDPDNQVRSDALNQLQDVAMSISYIDFPQGFDINDLHKQVSHDTFMAEIEAHTVEVADLYDWLPEEVRERQDKENVISLSEAQQKNRELMTTIGGNLRNYIGMKVLNNMPVGTGKTTSTIEGVNLAQRASSPTPSAYGKNWLRSASITLLMSTSKGLILIRLSICSEEPIRLLTADRISSITLLI